MKTRLLGAPLLTLVACSPVADDPPPPEIRLALLEATYESTPEPAIVFVARVPEAQTIPEAALPWGSPHSVRFTFRGAVGGPRCRVVLHTVGMKVGDVALSAGEVLHGRVALREHCRNISDLVAFGPVAVEWEYTPPMGMVADREIAGVVTIPRSATVD